jgi:hypothetical protein
MLQIFHFLELDIRTIYSVSVNRKKCLDFPVNAHLIIDKILQNGFFNTLGGLLLL